jgi:hypothetical protein
MIVKASSTLTTIIQTFENRTTEQAEFENLLSGHLIFYFLSRRPLPPPPLHAKFLTTFIQTCVSDPNPCQHFVYRDGNPEPGSPISADP